MKKIAIVTSGYFPVPPILGGAIETLIMEIVEENEINGKADLTVYSAFNSLARLEAKKICNTKIEYIKTPLVIKCLDGLIYYIAKNIFKKKKHMSYRYILQRLFFIFRVACSISRLPFDAIVYENHMSLLLSLKLFKNYERYKGKFYYHAHNTVNGFYGCRKLIEDIALFLCVSKYIQKNIMDYTGISDPGKYYILKNRVNEKALKNVNHFKLEAFRRKLIGTPEDVILTFIGRLNPEKGAKELLYAFKAANIEKCKLLIVGSYYFGANMQSAYEMELKQISDSIADRIVYTGHVDYEVIPYIYAMSDIVIVPSIWDDPAPLTVVEALTVGKPLITTYSGGIPEYAREESSLILRRDDNLVMNLKEALVKVVSDHELREKLSVNAQMESKNWTIENYYFDFLNAIKRT